MSKRSRRRRREEAVDPPRPKESRAAGCFREFEGVAILLFCVCGFGAMILEPKVAVAWEAGLLAATAAIPAVLLVWQLRDRDGPVVGLLLPTLATGAYAAIAINMAIKGGPDWRLASTILIGGLWLTLAGVAWARKR